MEKREQKTAALHNLGCKVNAYETQAMRQMLEEAGYKIVDFTEKADVYVVNTCSVTNIADRKSRQMIHRARKSNPNGIVVAAGCYAQTKTEEMEGQNAADIVIGNNNKHTLIHAIRSFEEDNDKRVSVLPINHVQPYERLWMTRPAERTRAFLKVQDGCNQFCSYCIIPYARGRVRSRRLSDVLEEAKELASNGCREIVLTGIHLSSYGTDTGENLLDLIRECAKIEGIVRVRLGSLEPGIITEAFADALAKIPEICPHFHLSLQSGCDRTLLRMNRKYTTEEYKKSCEMLRKRFAHPAITTDVIVGFPGETEEEFASTKAFLKEIHFYEMHIFKYSKREGTRAAAMEGQVPPDIKAARSAELITLGHAMSKEFRDYYIGREAEVLMEESFAQDGKQYFAGYTKEYVKICLETQENIENQLVKGKVMGRIKGDGLFMVEF